MSDAFRDGPGKVTVRPPSGMFENDRQLERASKYARTRLVDLMRSGYSAIDASEVVQREIREQFDDADKT